jgi:hypothetical protein
VESIRARATELLPSVLLTLLSMIQALALELLWSRLRDSPHLWAGGWEALLGWVQIAAMLLGFLQVWLFYTSLVMRFRWVPALEDSLIPFGIGILEFTLIDLLGPTYLGLWFVVLALVFAISVWASHRIFRRARRDAGNREFFENVPPAKRGDFLAPIVAVVGLASIGIVLHLSGHRGFLALAALVAAGVALAHQVVVVRRFWELMMSGEAAPE